MKKQFNKKRKKKNMEYLKILFKLVLAMILGGIIGWERETVNKPAGLRTYILTCLGATLITIVSTTLPGSDPGRIAAQIVSSMGVLGAIVVLREGTAVKGITTAIAMWLMAGVGIAIGIGEYFVAITTTVLTYGVLVFLRSFEAKTLQHGAGRLLTVKAKNRPGLIGEIGSALGSHKVNIVDIKLEVSGEEAEIAFKVTTPPGIDPSPLLLEIQSFPDVKVVRWE